MALWVYIKFVIVWCYAHECHMQKVLETSQEWAIDNKMRINPNKTKDKWICFSNAIPTPAPLILDGAVIERVNSHKLLGVWHQNNLKWNSHVEATVKKANKRLFCLRECRRASLPYEVGITCYRTKIRSILEYAAPIWGGLPQYLIEEIEQVQNRCLKILGLPQNELQTLKERRDNITIEEIRRIIRDKTHPCSELIPLHINHAYNLRTVSSIPQPKSYTQRHEKLFIPRAISLINKRGTL